MRRMADINALALSVANRLANRPVLLRWQNPPSSNAAGQIVKTQTGELVIYVGNLEGVNTRLKVLLHELAHARLDADWIPKSNDARLPSGSINRTQSQRKIWRAHPRELRAEHQADEWLRYANIHKFDYWRVGRSEMECKLLSLLDWRG